MTEQISLRMRIGGKEGWYPVVAWGTHWYEADGQWEVILEDTSDIEIHVETLAGDELQVEKVSLDGLKERNVRASFFLLGEKVEQYPELVERMQKEGHLVGNHTYHHVQLNKLNETKAREEILKTNNLIYETTGVYPLYLRPPFGAWKKNLELCVEMLPVFWTIDTLDWKVQNTEKIVRTVQEQIEDGAIILMHDEYDTSVEAALQVVDELKNQGYELVTVDQLILP